MSLAEKGASCNTVHHVNNHEELTSAARSSTCCLRCSLGSQSFPCMLSLPFFLLNLSMYRNTPRNMHDSWRSTVQHCCIAFLTTLHNM